MTITDDDIDALTPTENLMVELLVARHRCGEEVWTVHSRHTGTLRKLEKKGIVQWKPGIIEKSCLANLTDEAKDVTMSWSYTPPIISQREGTPPIEQLSVILAHFASAHPDCWDGPEIDGRCEDMSREFVHTCELFGLKAERVSGFGRRSGDDFLQGHAAVRVGPIVFDWTYRQFAPETSVPRVCTYEEFREEWPER